MERERSAGWDEAKPAVDEIAGFRVETREGRAGTVAGVNYKGTCLVVDTGPWIFGRKRLVPASAITTIDRSAKTVFVRVTRRVIDNAPEYDAVLGVDEDCERKVEAYYAEVSE